MPRNRIIYQSLALFASQVSTSGQQTGVGTIAQLHRLQSYDNDFSRSLTDVNQFGNLAAIDRIDLEAPTVNGSFSYYLTDGSNEKYIGLSVINSNVGGVSCLSGILKKETDEKNYYLLMVGEGSDAAGYQGPVSGVMALGNAFLTSYNLEASVNAIPTATVNVEALNMRFYNNVNGTNDVPAVIPSNGLPVTGVSFLLRPAVTNDSVNQPTALRPGDVEVDIFGALGVIISDLKVQSVSIGVDLSRTPLQKLGSRFPFSREIDFPLNATVSIEAELGDLNNGSVSDLLCETGVYNLGVKIRRNACSGNGAYAFRAELRGAKLDSESVSTAIGNNATISLQYSVPVSGPEDLYRGVFLSGSFA